MKKYGANEFTANVKKKRKSMPALSCSNDIHTQQMGRMKKRLSLNILQLRRTRRMSSKSRNEMKQMFTQAMLYMTAIILTFIFPLMTVIAQNKNNELKLWALQNFFLPLLGFFNFFIFIRPRIVIIMQAKPELSYFRVLITAVTAREIKEPSQKRNRLERTVNRTSLFRPHGLVDAARPIVAEESQLETTAGQDVAEEVKTEIIPMTGQIEVEELQKVTDHNIASNIDGSEMDADHSDAIMTEDYTNMV